MEQLLSLAAGRGQGRERRTFQPIRRRSQLAGRCEVGFWRPFAAGQVGDFMRAAERYDSTKRAQGEPQGPLGPIGLEVLRELLRLVDHATGRLDPSIDGLAARIRRSRDAVWRALKALKTHGFIDWIRRYVPAPTAGKAGPQVRQTSNAYRLMLPAIAKVLLGKVTRAPVPDDHEHRRKAMADQIRSMEADASGLTAILDRLGRAVLKRETARQTESAHSISIIHGKQQSRS